MARETYISKLQHYLETLSKDWNCGVWICKKFGKRLSFFKGVEPCKFLPPARIDINETYVLFIEDFGKVRKDLKKVVVEIKKILLTE